MDITDTISLGLLTRDFEEPFWPRLLEACVVQHSCFVPSGSLTDSVLQWFLLAETSAQSDVEAMRTQDGTPRFSSSAATVPRWDGLILSHPT